MEMAMVPMEAPGMEVEVWSSSSSSSSSAVVVGRAVVGMVVEVVEVVDVVDMVDWSWVRVQEGVVLYRWVNGWLGGWACTTKATMVQLMVSDERVDG